MSKTCKLLKDKQIDQQQQLTLTAMKDKEELKLELDEAKVEIDEAKAQVEKIQIKQEETAKKVSLDVYLENKRS